MFKIRKYKNGDENQILKLDRLVEEHPWNRRNIQNWYWKFKKSPNSIKPFVYVCELKNKIIATFSTIPINYYLNGKKTKFSNSIAMIVHPHFQDKGIMKFLGDQLLKDTGKKTDLVFGFPNKRSYLLHKAFFQYQDVFNQKLFELKNISKKNMHVTKKNIQLREIKKFSNKFDQIAKKNRKKFFYQTVRDSKYLNWRFIFRPDKKYYNFEIIDISNKKNVIGYIVLKLYKYKTDLYGHIIDYYIDTNNRHFYEESIVNALNFLKKKKSTIFSLWCQGDDKLLKTIKNLGFKKVSERPFICKIFNRKKINTNKIKNKWYFTMGDTLEVY